MNHVTMEGWIDTRRTTKQSWRTHQDWQGIHNVAPQSESSPQLTNLILGTKAFQHHAEAASKNLRNKVRGESKIQGQWSTMHQPNCDSRALDTEGRKKVVSFANAQAGPKTTSATLQVENTLVSASPSASGPMQIDPSSRPADLNLRIIHAHKNTDESVIPRSSKRRKLLPSQPLQTFHRVAKHPSTQSGKIKITGGQASSVHGRTTVSKAPTSAAQVTSHVGKTSI